MCLLTNEYIKKNLCIHVVEYYSALKKKEILSFATWMHLESIILSEISQTEKDKYCMVSLLCEI